MLPQACISVLEKHAPEYFSLDADARELWRATLGDNSTLYKAIQLSLMVDSYGMTEKKAKKRLKFQGKKRFNPDEQAWLNYHMLFLTGIGRDNFVLNECLADGVTLLDYPTLLAYDKEDFLFQEHARERDFNIPAKHTYKGSLAASWARCVKDGKLTYINLSMAGYYIHFELEEVEHTLFDSHLPHSYYKGENHGQKSGGGFLWDMRINANGKEALYEAMRTASREYINSRTDALLEEMDAANLSQIWMVANPNSLGDSKDDLNYSVVFSDKSVLDVSFTNFLSDVAARAGDMRVLETLIEREKSAYTAWFEKTLAEKEAGGL